MTALEGHYLTLACFDGQNSLPHIYAEMRLEVHNTKSVLLNILKSKHTDYLKFIDAIITLTKFCRSIGDFDTILLDQAIEFLNNNNDETTLLSIKCLQTWGELYYYANDMKSAKNKLLEAEKLCLLSSIDSNHLYGSILTILGQICLSQHKLNEAADLYQRALHLHKTTNDILG